VFAAENGRPGGMRSSDTKETLRVPARVHLRSRGMRKRLEHRQARSVGVVNPMSVVRSSPSRENRRPSRDGS